MTERLQWKRIHSLKSGESYAGIPSVVSRSKIPDGWLVYIDIDGQSPDLTFVPDPDHKWDGSIHSGG